MKFHEGKVFCGLAVLLSVRIFLPWNDVYFMLEHHIDEWVVTIHSYLRDINLLTRYFLKIEVELPLQDRQDLSVNVSTPGGFPSDLEIITLSLLLFIGQTRVSCLKLSVQ